MGYVPFPATVVLTHRSGQRFEQPCATRLEAFEYLKFAIGTPPRTANHLIASAPASHRVWTLTIAEPGKEESLKVGQLDVTLHRTVRVAEGRTPSKEVTSAK